MLFNKSGQVGDAIGPLIAIVLLLSASFVGFVLSNKINSVWFGNAELNASSQSVTILTRVNTYYTSTIDNLIIFVWFGLVIVAIGSALLTPTSKIFFFFNIIIMMLLLIPAVAIHYWYNAFIVSDPADFNAIIPFYPKTDYLFSHIELFTFISMLVISIAMWGGNKRSNGLEGFG